MTDYYLDIETTGLNPNSAEIITIQTGALDIFEGIIKSMEPLKIWRSWTSSEKGVLESFLQIARWNQSDVQKIKLFNFVAWGYNLPFEFDFILTRSLKYNLTVPDWRFFFYTLPKFDLKQVAILVNEGQFKGSGLDDMAKKFLQEAKPTENANIPQLFQEQKFAEIEKYIRKEAELYVKLYNLLQRAFRVGLK